MGYASLSGKARTDVNNPRAFGDILTIVGFMLSFWDDRKSTKNTQRSDINWV
jgi:hypothetical protein